MKLFAICNFFIFSLCFKSVYGSSAIRSFVPNAASRPGYFVQTSIRWASSQGKTKVPFNYGNDRLKYVEEIAVFNPGLSKALAKSFSAIGRTPIESFDDRESEEQSVDESRLKLAQSLYKKGAMPLTELTKHFGFSEDEIKR